MTLEADMIKDSNRRGAASEGVMMFIPLTVLIGFVLFFSGGPGAFLVSVDRTIRDWALVVFRWIASFF